MEIERKFALSKNQYEKLRKTHFSGYIPVVIYQKYISLVPELRIRERKELKGTRYFFCMKSEGGLSRFEFEKEITEAEYENIWKFMRNPTEPVYSCIKRHNKNEFGLEVSLVVFPDGTELYYAEKEFYSEEEAKSWVPDFEFERDITDDISMNMKYLCKEHHV